MGRPGLVGRLDDLLNPIVVKELRQAVKSRLVVVALLLLLALQVFILGAFLMFRAAERGREGIDFRAGAQVFATLQGILLGVCMLLIPLYTGVRLAAERSDTNVDLLFISTLRPRAIIAGKFLAAFVLILLIFSACAPFMTFAYLLRGLDLPTVLLVLGIDFLAVLAVTQLAVFFAAVPANAPLKVLLGLVGFGCLVVVFYVALAGTVSLVQFNWLLTADAPSFWGTVLGAAAAVLALIGLLFVWSIAVVSPSSANRALPVRVYVLGQWLATGAAAGVCAYTLRRPGGDALPVAIWVVLSVLLACLQLGVAINERERWGPRVARTIPRNALLRGPAFLLYSGAAGGLTFATLLAGLTFLAALACRKLFPDLLGARALDPVAAGMAGAFLYAFCYGLTAVFARRLLPEGRLRPGFTWVLATLFLGVGSTIPYVLVYLFNEDLFNRPPDEPWWQLGNPFAAVFDVIYRHSRGLAEPYASPTFWFLGIWAVLAAAVNAPWFVRQVRRFHPPPAEGSPSARAA